MWESKNWGIEVATKRSTGLIPSHFTFTYCLCAAGLLSTCGPIQKLICWMCLLQALTDNSDLVFVRPSWIHACHNAQKYLPYQKFAVLPTWLTFHVTYICTTQILVCCQQPLYVSGVCKPWHWRNMQNPLPCQILYQATKPGFVLYVHFVLICACLVLLS